MKKFFRIGKFLLIPLAILMLGPLSKLFFSHRPKEIYAPRHIEDLSLYKDRAAISVYGAGAGRWQWFFSLHTWVAVKRSGDQEFTIYEVIWDRPSKGLPAVEKWTGNPDRSWANNPPELLYHLEGKKAEDLIPLIEQAVARYPFQDYYTVWPGPNCNTFTAYIGRSVKELQMHLPAHAVGKDFLPPGQFFTVPPSGSGFQFSLCGLLGITFSKIEGLEIDYLGLNFGLDHNNLSLLYPGIGKISLMESPQ